MKISFIGLGIMGSRMAQNLLKNGAELTVYNRSQAPVEALKALGAVVASSAATAVNTSDIVFTMLSTPEVVAALAFGPEGFLAAMPKGALWVDCSTVNPSFSLQAANEARSAGIRFLDAPVTGTKGPAAAGELTFFVGGNAADLDQARPFMEHMGSKILHMGETGKGASFKMLLNAMLAQTMVLFSETVLLGEKMGFSRDMLFDTLPNLPIAAPFLKGKAELIRSGDFTAHFPLELMQKDLHLAAVTAYEHGQPLYLANLAKEMYAQATKSGFGRDDFAAIFKYLEG